MRAAQLVAPGRFEVVEVDDPVPGEGQILLSMRCASICGSDLHLVFDPRTPTPLSPGRPGHEGVGEVVDAGTSGLRVGDLVLAVPLASEGAGFAERQVVRAASAIVLPPGLPPERALMAQQLGTVVFGFRRYWPRRSGSGKTAGVIGAGSAGIFALQLALLFGFEHVVVADLEASRLELAQRLGATTTVLVPSRSFAEVALEVTRGRGLDLVVEASGQDTCRAAAVEAASYGARLGYFGLPEGTGESAWPFATAFAKGCAIEMAGFAQREEGLSSFKEALELLSFGRIDVEAMLESRYRLDDVQKAMTAAHERTAIKVNLDFGV